MASQDRPQDIAHVSWLPGVLVILTSPYWLQMQVKASFVLYCVHIFFYDYSTFLWRLKTILRSWSSPATLWDLGIKLRPSISTSTCYLSNPKPGFTSTCRFKWNPDSFLSKFPQDFVLAPGPRNPVG